MYIFNSRLLPELDLLMIRTSKYLHNFGFPVESAPVWDEELPFLNDWIMHSLSSLDVMGALMESILEYSAWIRSLLSGELDYVLGKKEDALCRLRADLISFSLNSCYNSKHTKRQVLMNIYAVEMANQMISWLCISVVLFQGYLCRCS